LKFYFPVFSIFNDKTKRQTNKQTKKKKPSLNESMLDVLLHACLFEGGLFGFTHREENTHWLELDSMCE
jgi:hypothetical protein